MYIDLHSHTTASDGTLSPSELVRLAKKTGLSAVAITDHDTLQGLEEALDEGKRIGMEVIPGVELSVGEGRQSMHIVGLFVKPGSPKLTKAFDFVQHERGQRNQKIVNKLNELGVDVALDEIKALAGGTVGRPHFAQVLLNKGVVSDFREAFDVYLGNTGKAYIPRTRLTPKQGLELLDQDQATSILAHPGLLNFSFNKLDVTLAELKELGLKGVEAFYTEHTTGQTSDVIALARKHGLLLSGGSDFHGDVKPKISLGTGRGGLMVPVDLLDAIKEHRRKNGLWV